MNNENCNSGNHRSNADFKAMVRRQKRALRREGMKKFWKRFCKNKAAVLGLIVFVLIVLMAIFAPVIAPYSAYDNSFKMKTAPNAVNLCGTGELGRDVLSRTIMIEQYPDRLRVRDTDGGEDVKRRIADLKQLLDAYRSGLIRTPSRME